MDADDHRGGLRTPILVAAEASGSNGATEAREQEARQAGHCSDKALKLILGLQFLEVTAFYGIYLSLIVYLQDVFHGHSASNVATVNHWIGVSYHMPVLGAAVADSFWGEYKTVLIGLSVSVVGMAIVTASATLPSLSPSPCTANTICTPATLSQQLVFFSGLYLCGIGIGASKSVFISFGAEQLDDDGSKIASGRGAKASYFSWYYAVANMGIVTAGTLLVCEAVSDASLSVGQLEFFYEQSPETMKGVSTAFYFVSVSIGNLIKSLLVTLVASVTAAGGRTGWFPPELDEGHLDYYFLLVVAVIVVNFAVFVALAKNYKPRSVIHPHLSISF